MTKNDNQIDENAQKSLEENNLVDTEEKQDNPVAQELNDENKQTVVLTAPAALSNDEFKYLFLNDFIENNHDYYNEVLDTCLEDDPKLKDNPQELTDAAYGLLIGFYCDNVASEFLEEKVDDAYKSLLKICYFKDDDYVYMAALAQQNENSASFIPHIHNRLAEVNVLQPLLGLGKTIAEARDYATNPEKDVNNYNTAKILEQFNQFEPDLSAENKAKINYIASKMYYRMRMEKADFGPAKDMELNCLRKALTYSSDYKLISYCQGRLSDPNDKIVLRAYKHALSSAKDKSEKCQINLALADIYTSRATRIGFMTQNSDKKISGEKALHHLMDAYRYSPKDTRIHVLKRIAEMQRNLGRKEDWKNTKTVIALKFLKGEERCMALSSIADKTHDLSYYHKALTEAKKAKISAVSKARIQEIVYGKLLNRLPEGEEKADVAKKLEHVKKISLADMRKLYSLKNDKSK